MSEKAQINLSKFLSLVLRHKPEVIDLTLDEKGWANTEELLGKVNKNGFELTLEELKTMVINSDKNRFELLSDYSKIRANQGHSVNVDLELIELKPPDVLFHGTAKRNLQSIKNTGLQKGQRHHVHLSTNLETARSVGQRYGKPVVLTIKSGLMFKQGLKFFKSKNDVWLTNRIDPKYIEF